MNISRCIAFTLLAGTAFTLSAQTVDSIAAPVVQRWRPSEERWLPAAFGAGMVVEGLVSSATRHDIGNPAPDVAGKSGSVAVDVAQYVPLAFPWVMKAFGADTRSSWGRMAVSQAFGTAIMAGGVYLTKHAVSERRPDATDNRSFPSGHSAWAFMGATYTAIELGSVSPWYAAGAYAFATGVAVQRVVADRHHAADVIAGAGIGIVAAELGYYLGDVIFCERGVSRPYMSIEGGNRSFVSLTTAQMWPVGRIGIGDGAIVRLPAVAAGIKGGLALGDHWGLSLTALLQSVPLQVEQTRERTYIGTQSLLGLTIAPYYTLALSHRVSLNAEIGAGYFKHLSLRSVGDAVTTGWGTPEGHASVGAVINLTDRISCTASVGYHAQHYSYSLHPSGLHASGTAGAVSIGLSTRINLN